LSDRITSALTPFQGVIGLVALVVGILNFSNIIGIATIVGGLILAAEALSAIPEIGKAQPLGYNQPSTAPCAAPDATAHTKVTQ
jgi:hypothetical protein